MRFDDSRFGEAPIKIKAKGLTLKLYADFRIEEYGQPEGVLVYRYKNGKPFPATYEFQRLYEDQIVKECKKAIREHAENILEKYAC